MKPITAALMAGALSGSLTAASITFGSGVPFLSPGVTLAAAAPAAPAKYEYQIATVDMLNKTVTVGDKAQKFSMTESFDEMLSKTAQKGGWRVTDVYTIGAFGPFFLMEREAQ